MSRRWIFWIALTLILIGALAGFGFAAWRATENRFDRLEAELGTLPRLNARIEKLESRLVPLESRPDGAEIAQRALAEDERLNRLISGLEARILALETKGPSPALEARVAALEQNTIHGQDAERIDQERAKALGCLVLVQAIDQGAPFEAELTALRRIAKDNTLFADLAPAAAAGIPRRDQLITQFEGVARSVSNAPETPSSTESWWQRLLNHARKLIVIRQTAPLPGDQPFAIIARAQSDLARDRLDAAVDEISHLKGPAAEAAASWLQNARLRLLAETEIAAYTANLLAPSSGAKP